MARQETIIDEDRVEIYLNLYTFKRCSVLQSYVISILSRMNVNDEEQAILRRMFIELDTTKNGFLSVDEIRDGMKTIEKTFNISLGKNENFEPEWDSAVNCIDVDKDGQVSFEEFVTAASDRHRLINDENNLKQAFDFFDKEGNGHISISQLKECFGYNNQSASLEIRDTEKVDDDTEAKIVKLFEEIDKNSDGKIDLEEFSEHMMGLVRKGVYDKRKTKKFDSQLQSRVEEKKHSSNEQFHP